MRTFIAIELPEEIKKSLSKLQEQLKTTGADVKWVEPKNIHLTLKFLGERDDKKVKGIESLLSEVSSHNNSFKIRINSVGAFPNLNSPRVIWVGIDEGDSETKKIAQELEEKIAKLGIPKEERAFSSHITIGRKRSAKNLKELSESLKKASEGKFDLPVFAVDKITLFKSTLTSQGPIYEPVKIASLTTA
jgi:2'-5' RNA ligase